MASPRSPYYEALAAAGGGRGILKQDSPYFKAVAKAPAQPSKNEAARAFAKNRTAPETSAGDGEQMQATIFKVVLLPQVLEREPIAVARATTKPCRILVKNISAGNVNLGWAAQDIQGPAGLGADRWVLLPGDNDVIVAAPGQVLYGNGSAPNTQVCVSVSEAYPPL